MHWLSRSSGQATEENRSAMTTHDVKADPMAGRIARWDDIQRNGIPVMFIDSVLPGHFRMNYSVIGDTASENPDFEPAISAPHKFQIGMFEAPPGNGPGWHTHTYVELFVPLTGAWRFVYGANPDDPEGDVTEVVLRPWDVISFPPGLWRRFENASDANAVGFAVLDPHDVFLEKDPIWPEWLVEQAAARGLSADASGRMIKPDDFSRIESEVRASIAGP
jgi:quercetin dioxygenase-like cupin family protein